MINEGRIHTVQSFQGSGFSVDLPEDASDASSYCFLFPNAGEYAPNLTTLALSRQRISDISRLRVLGNLRQLELSHNRIEDISVLAELQREGEALPRTLRLVPVGEVVAAVVPPIVAVTVVSAAASEPDTSKLP